MPRTFPRIAFSLYAMTIKSNASLDFSALHSLGDINNLITNEVITKPIITFEYNFWLLDGNYKFRPDNDADANIGIISTTQSDASGIFSIPPVLTITFGNVQTSDGLTLRFAPYTNDFSNDIDVAYYDASDVLIRTDSYTPTSWEFSTSQAVSNFKKIIITFNGTNNPYRYLRLSGIDFGELAYFESDELKSASVIQEIKPIADELPIGKLELSLFSNNAALNIINPSDEYAQLKEKQPLDVYEFIGAELAYIGRYYMGVWKNTSNNEIKFTAEDILGILNTQKYYGGIWGAKDYADNVIEPATTAGDLIDSIMTEVNVPYELDSSLASISIVGWLPICSYREALQQIAFAIGAYIVCKSGIVKIKETVLASDLVDHDFEITKAQKSISQSLEIKNLVTGVEVQGHEFVQVYVPGATDTQIFYGILNAGEHIIEFNKPIAIDYIGLTVGVTKVSGNCNHVVISVPSTMAVEITSGIDFTDLKNSKIIENTLLPNGTTKNIISITDATLVNFSLLNGVTQRVYDYYQQRYLQNVKLFALDVRVGDSVLMDIFQDSQLSGIVEKMTIDLVGGFLQNTEITGVVVE